MNFGQNLFQQAAVAARQGGAGKPLLEVKAGKMTKEGKTVKADPRKGLIQLTVEESILHFKWKDRTANRVEDDLMLFPGDANLKRIEKVKDGRVYVLEFTNTSREMFFWLQEPKTDKDDEYCNKINEYIKNPPQSGQYTQQQQNFMNMFSGGQQQQGRHTGAASSAIELDQLQRILQGLGPQQQQQSSQQQQQQQQPSSQQSTTTTTTTTTATQQQQQQEQQQQQQQVPFDLVQTPQVRGPGLSAILNSDAVASALRRNPEVVKQLVEHLPDNEKNADLETVIQHIRSPPFRQSVDAFTRALYQSPEAVLYSIGIIPTNALLARLYSGTGAEAFVNAVNNQENKDNSSSGDKKDDKMETDE